MGTIIDLLNAVKEGLTNKKEVVPYDMLLNNIKHNMTKTTSAERLKIVRATYKASGKLVARAMGIAYRNYQKYESGDTEPSPEAIRRLSCFTGISPSWLLGISDEIYDEGTITAIENSLIFKDDQGLSYFIFGNESQHFKIFPLNYDSLDERYADLEQRRKIYSLTVRANIIYLINVYVINGFVKNCFGINDKGEAYVDWLTVLDKVRDETFCLMHTVYIAGAPDDKVNPTKTLLDVQAELDKHLASRASE